MTRTLRLKVRPESYRRLEAAAIEVNQIWNWCNEISARRSLGWVPFKAASLKRKGKPVRFCGKSFRLFQAEQLEGVRWQQGCFAQDAVGDWWLCLPVEYRVERSVAPLEAVGIDLGLKAIATTSDGEMLDAGRWTQRYADRLATAQRRGHKRQAKRLHRRIARCRADALHKFSRKIIDRYQAIVVGDVSSTQLVKTRMAKSVLDSGGCSGTCCSTRASTPADLCRSSRSDSRREPAPAVAA